MKAIKFIALTISLCNTPLTCPMESSSWLSPSYFSNWLQNNWFVKQINAVRAKTTSAQEQEQKWAHIYRKKERASKTPITDAQTSALKFKQIIEDAALTSEVLKTNSIMARFKDHPEKFLFGASSSSYQYEGGLDVQNQDGTYRNANAQFYHDKGLKLASDAIDFWNRHETDIRQMKEELGINAFRISIAWDRVEPQQGQYNGEAIKRYAQIIQTLKQHNIEPIVVLHHYTTPTWFENLGGFAEKENIDHFVNFGTTMYNALHQHVTYWSTFNAIEGYAFKGYFKLDGPPGKEKSMQTTQHVMANMLETHVRFYQAIKDKEDGLYYQKYQTNNTIPNPQIGIQKNIVILEPDPQSNLCVLTASGVCSVIGEGAQNKGFFDFFTTGTFNVRTPRQVYHHNPQAPESLDWIGLNVYSNMLMRLTAQQEELDEDKATANKTYRDYPEGIYRATEELYHRIAKPLALPIIITENGIATTDDAKRTRFYQRALFTIRMLIKEGYPIIGYTPWSSHDNYEWPTTTQPDPWNRPYGFFAVDRNNNLQRSLKQGAHYYRDFVKTYLNQKTKPTLSWKQPLSMKPWKE